MVNVRRKQPFRSLLAQYAQKDLALFPRFVAHPTYGENRATLLPIKPEREVQLLVQNSCYHALSQPGRPVVFMLPITLTSWLQYKLLYNQNRRLIKFFENEIREGQIGKTVPFFQGVGAIDQQIGLNARVVISPRDLLMMVGYINKRYRTLYKQLSTNIVRRPN